MEKIYKIPVIKVNTRIQLGEIKRNEIGRIVKDDDIKVAYVYLVSIILCYFSFLCGIKTLTSFFLFYSLVTNHLHFQMSFVRTKKKKKTRENLKQWKLVKPR